MTESNTKQAKQITESQLHYFPAQVTGQIISQPGIGCLIWQMWTITLLPIYSRGAGERNGHINVSTEFQNLFPASVNVSPSSLLTVTLFLLYLLTLIDSGYVRVFWQYFTADPVHFDNQFQLDDACMLLVISVEWLRLSLPSSGQCKL